MSEMVERVARAIFAAKPQTHTTWEQCDWAYRTMKLKEARAAIEAMRDLPADMPFPDAVKQYWQAVIDEALKD